MGKFWVTVFTLLASIFAVISIFEYYGWIGNSFFFGLDSGTCGVFAFVFAMLAILTEIYVREM